MRPTHTLTAIILVVGILPPVAAQDASIPAVIRAASSNGAVSYDASIPTPLEVLGYDIGSRHTEPHQVVRYFEAVANASERVTLREHARSHEGRPLVHAIVGTPEHLAGLEQIRTANLRLSDTPGSVTDSEVDAMPAIVLMSYSVHGNEASGTEAAMLLLYHLAAGNDPVVAQILDGMMVIVDPMLNPDGRARFTTWANRNRGRVAVSDPENREHNEPWPGGRTNHYWFDLNRDYVPGQHPETRGRLELFHHWRPQIVIDAHEMGSESTYFFQPGIPSRTNPNTPRLNQELTARVARFHAEALDALPALFYSEETFDDFYYGKWSTYPDINGAVGILFEQASSRALVRDTKAGRLHYATTVRNQFATSLSTLRAAREMRPDLLRYQRDFYAEAARRSDRSAGGLLATAGSDRSRRDELADLLRRHRIKVHVLDRPTATGGVDFTPDASLFIPWDQPQSRLIDALFERRTEFADSIFYDISAWTLPLAFDMQVADVRSVPDGVVGAEWSDEPAAESSRSLPTSAPGYVMTWDDFYSARVLDRLQASGADTRVATRTFSASTPGGTKSFPPGTIVITRGALSADSLARTLAGASRGEQVTLHAVTSGLTEAGPDLGSPRNRLLTRRRTAIVTGEGTSAYRAGEVWHLLSERARIPVTLLDADRIKSADLSRYTTIVIAGGRSSSEPVETVQEWVEDGGHLILLSDATLWALGARLVDADSISVDLDSVLTDVPYSERSRARGAQYLGGAILDTVVDTTHPLAYGVGSRIPVFRQGRHFIASSNPDNIVVSRYAQQPLLSGYAPARLSELIPGTVSVMSVPRGSGQIILFADIPSFRGFWFGSSRMLINAIFFSEAI